MKPTENLLLSHYLVNTEEHLAHEVPHIFLRSSVDESHIGQVATWRMVANIEHIKYNRWHQFCVNVLFHVLQMPIKSSNPALFWGPRQGLKTYTTDLKNISTLGT